MSVALGCNLGLNEFEYNLILTRSFNYHGHPPLPRISKYLLHLSLHMLGEMHAYKVARTKLRTSHVKLFGAMVVAVPMLS